MSSTTDWRNLADRPRDGFYQDSALRDALRAACARLDEQANLLSIANEKWGEALARAEAAEARIAELEAKLNHESYVSDKRAQERDKAEVRLAVAVDGLQEVLKEGERWDMSMVVWIARAALAKLKGERDV